MTAPAFPMPGKENVRIKKKNTMCMWQNDSFTAAS
jgi:hypothetical protein